MLTELRIKNFILIENLTLSYTRGLNILTGETGAGKSILIDAISGVLGEKMSTDMIRSGFERATLEGVFDISSLSQVKSILDESGIDCDNDELTLKRELYSSGKGRCFANATQIPVGKMQEISEYLIDIHGQNEHQNIARVAKHREMLDAFAGTTAASLEMGELYRGLASLKEAMQSFQMDEREKARRTEYLSFAVNEIDAAKLSPNEEEELQEEAHILSHAEKLFMQVNTSSALMKGDGGVLQSLKRIEQSLSAVSDFDPNITSVLEEIRESLYSLEDASSFFRDYEKNFNFSPERQAEVEERLSLLQSLKKKYGATLAEVLAYAEKSRTELDAITSSEDRIEKLKEEYRALVLKTKEKAVALSAARSAAAKDLETKVMAELADLGMAGTVFKVSIKQEISDSGEIESDNKKYMLYPHGLDRIEFLLAANAGEELHELRKVASGGEMSRIMLALKKVLLSNDIVESLIFDEVDTGISGKTAEVVGKKLKSLASTRQVLVITHLPQIAAMSDNHFRVSKETVQDRTITSVKTLSRDEKIHEVARMLAGETITDLSLKHAAEMVALAEGC